MLRGRKETEPLSLAEAFALIVAEAGLPGSGHTRPDHPMLDWIADRFPTDLAGQLTEVRDAARLPVTDAAAPLEIIRELTPSGD